MIETEALDWLIRHGYLIMFLVMLVEGPAVNATAALGASQGHFNVFIVFGLSFFANFLPDVLYYLLGNWTGQWMLDRFGPRIGIAPARRERAAGLITNNMGKWLLFIKTIPLISPPGLAVMGALGVSMRRFIWWDMAIVALVSAMFTTLGYFSGEGYGVLRTAFGYGPLWLGVIITLFVLASLTYSRVARRYTRRMQQSISDDSDTQHNDEYERAIGKAQSGDRGDSR